MEQRCSQDGVEELLVDMDLEKLRARIKQVTKENIATLKDPMKVVKNAEDVYSSDWKLGILSRSFYYCGRKH